MFHRYWDVLITVDPRRTRALQAHLACVISIGHKISSELDILFINCILPDMGKQQDQGSSYESHRRCHKEWVAARRDLVVARRFLDRVESVGSSERTNLPYGRSDTVVLTSEYIVRLQIKERNE